MLSNMNTLLKIQILQESARKDKISKRCLKDLSNYINVSEAYLLKNCGVSRLLFHQLLKILQPFVPETRRANGIPFTLKVLLTLSFLNSGLHQKSIGKDFGLCISQKSVSRSIKNIVEGLNMVLNNWIVFPSTSMQRKQIKEGFCRKYSFPETIGCINGTYVDIVCPRDDEDAFYDRKGQYSIHAQIICDADLRILAICSRFGGAASNTYIWNKMNVKQFIENINNQGENSWLVGDNKYPQRPWLMTPILNAMPGTPELHYNNVHGSTRTCIEKCISRLKGHWRCLQRPLHYTPQRAAKIINACAVLHNLGLKADLPEPMKYTEVDMPFINEVTELADDNVNDLFAGLEIRRQLTEKLYYSV